MSKEKFNRFELDEEYQNADLDKNNDFIKNYETIILLSLVEKKLLTQEQFDKCMEKVT